MWCNNSYSMMQVVASALQLADRFCVSNPDPETASAAMNRERKRLQTNSNEAVELFNPNASSREQRKLEQFYARLVRKHSSGAASEVGGTGGGAVESVLCCFFYFCIFFYFFSAHPHRSSF